MKVLVSDNLHEDGVAILKQHPNIEVVVRSGMKLEELQQEIKDADGLVIRSATKVTPELIDAAPRLKVVGRVGSNSLTMRAEARNCRLKCDSLASDHRMMLGWLRSRSTIFRPRSTYASRHSGRSERNSVAWASVPASSMMMLRKWRWIFGS